MIAATLRFLAIIVFFGGLGLIGATVFLPPVDGLLFIGVVAMFGAIAVLHWLEMPRWN